MVKIPDLFHFIIVIESTNNFVDGLLRVKKRVEIAYSGPPRLLLMPHIKGAFGFPDCACHAIGNL
jgi:hypothetical protein